MKLSFDTDRLTIRLIKESDLESIHQLHSIAEVDKFNTQGIPKDIDETKQIMDRWFSGFKKEPVQSLTFAILNKADQRFVGIIGILIGKPRYESAELWYKLHPDHWGNGFATEALKRMIAFLFEEKACHRLEAGCAVDNLASVKVLEKSGMIREGRKRKLLPLKSGWSDIYEYGLLEEDYFS
jgi:RimJ/RimL family protein N-acetyltransferase